MGASQSKNQSSNAEMALKIFEQELKNAEENFAFSPLSIESALAMVTLGSKGPSKDQLLNFLGHGKSGNLGTLINNLGVVSNSFQDLDSSIIWDFVNVAFVQENCDLQEDYTQKLYYDYLQEDCDLQEDYTEKLYQDYLKENCDLQEDYTDKLYYDYLQEDCDLQEDYTQKLYYDYLQEDCDLQEDYTQKLSNQFGATVKSVDFENYPKAARVINDFVKANTHDKIKKIVEGEELQNATIALVTVLYFNGLWREPFDVRLTSQMDFHVTDNKTVKADFMNKTSNVLMGKFESSDVVALPYVGDRFVMFLIVPDQHRDQLHMKPEDVVDNLKHTKFTVKMTNLVLPKFKIKFSMNLDERLKNFGVHDIFDPAVANLTGISQCKTSLHVSKIKHKVYLKHD